MPPRLTRSSSTWSATWRALCWFGQVPELAKLASSCGVLVNLLLQDVCGPDEIVLLAFGTLAAAEMRQRVAAAARSVGYRGDVDRIKISTIHAMSHRILSAHHRRVRPQIWLFCAKSGGAARIFE